MLIHFGERRRIDQAIETLDLLVAMQKEADAVGNAQAAGGASSLSTTPSASLLTPHDFCVLQPRNVGRT